MGENNRTFDRRPESFSHFHLPPIRGSLCDGELSLDSAVGLKKRRGELHNGSGLQLRPSLNLARLSAPWGGGDLQWMLDRTSGRMKSVGANVPSQEAGRRTQDEVLVHVL